MNKSEIRNSNNKQTADKTHNNKYLFLLAGIILLTIILFSKASNNGFIDWDDSIYTTGNSYIKNFTTEGIIDIFKSYSKDELPVTVLSFAIDYKLWGFNPKPYHIENIIFHLINIILVFILISKITKRKEIGLITALLFAIHPLRIESVVWIAERKDMLLGLFYISSLICYVNYINSNKQTKYLVYSLILAILALMSKFTAVTLPVVLFLIDYYYSRKISWKTVLEKIPFFIMPICSGLIHYSTESTDLLVSTVTNSYSFIDTIFFAGYSIVFYLFKMPFPFNLSALHTYPAKINNHLPAEYYVCFFIALIILALIIWIIYKYKDIRKDIIFGFGFFFITIALVLQIVPFGGWAVVSERYTYLPYIGLFFLIGKLFYWIHDNQIKIPVNVKASIKYLFIAYIILFSIITFNRIDVWKNSITLFDDIIEKDSSIYIAYMNRGYAKYNNNDTEGALADFDKTIELNPNYVEAYNIRGAMMNNMQNYKKAIDNFNKIIALNPKFTPAYNNRGNSKLELKNYKGAIEDYNKALEIEPDYFLAYNNIGRVKCFYLDDFKGAIDDFNKAIAIEKTYGEAYFNRSYCYMKLNNNNRCCEDLKKAEQLGYEKASDLIKQYCK